MAPPLGGADLLWWMWAGLAVQVRLGQWWDITILLYYGVLMAYSWDINGI